MKSSQKPSTDFAVALRYDEQSAPRVTAKGQGHVADEIIKVARDNDVPILGEPQRPYPLANVDRGQQIPETLYVAVAEVIALSPLRIS